MFIPAPSMRPTEGVQGLIDRTCCLAAFRFLKATLMFVLLLIGSGAKALAQQVVAVKVHSLALEHNLLGDSADQDVAIYLPAAYRSDPERHFATIYFLHGFADTPVKEVAEILQKLTDPLIDPGAIAPMIVVAPNGLNRYFGSFYTNSEVTGSWEDYITRDVVGYVDAHYRTLPSTESQGITGHSMGGYGVLMLAFSHPDIFSNVYAMSPCCTVLDGDIGPSSPVWAHASQVTSSARMPDVLHREFLLAVVIAMDAAFAPDPHNLPLLGHQPFFTQGEQSVPDPNVLSQFQSRIVVTAIPLLLNGIFKLKGIYIEYGAGQQAPGRSPKPVDRRVAARRSGYDERDQSQQGRAKHSSYVPQRMNSPSAELAT